MKFILTLFLFWTTISSGNSCGFPGAPAHSQLEFNTEENVVGTSVVYSCDRGFELLGPSRRICTENGTWSPFGIPFCVLNVALGKAPMQSSLDGPGSPQKALDGSSAPSFDPSTCTLTKSEQSSSPWWYVNLLEPYMIQLVRLDFGLSCCGKDQNATIVVRIGNNRPDLAQNPICNIFTGSLEEGLPLFLPCNPPLPGAFVSVHFEEPSGKPLSLCEVFVYTDQALPIERCPTFRDASPGSTATYNGKCYIFYDKTPLNFQKAIHFCESREGSLVDEANPALQGFLSWELWRRHKQGNSRGSQYWLGAFRSSSDPKKWSWISGSPVTTSFWNLPGGPEYCARFDGTKGWLWSDTNCALRLNYICVHKPTTCGTPELPPNSNLSANGFSVGSLIRHSCEKGFFLVGPSSRKCLSTGFYSEFPPVCRMIDCGPSPDVTHGTYVSDDSSSMLTLVCEIGFTPRSSSSSSLRCEETGEWSGLISDCVPRSCETPPSIAHGTFELSSNRTVYGSTATYTCTDSSSFFLRGNPVLSCGANGLWSSVPPTCESGAFGRRQWTGRPFTRGQRDSKRPFTLPPREDFRAPISNDVPNFLNAQVSRGQDASLPFPVQEDTVSNASSLNLGGIIALGVFGGFVFLAAIITTIVILVRRKSTDELGFRNRMMDESRFSESGSRNVSEGSEVRPEKSRSTHHHHHHHRHKHRKSPNE